MDKNIYDRTGIAAVSDLTSPAHFELFKVLENAQSEFLSKQHLFLSPEYIWPRDPLHTWSRVWEYPYTYHHLRNWRSAWRSERLPVVADIGSGVTFFPFLIARLGCQVICLDTDPVCQRDLNQATLHMAPTPGQLGFKLIDGIKLELADESCDAVYCVSVLEHIPNFRDTIREIARILKPGGIFVLTVDLDLQGNSEIRVERYSELLEGLLENFDFLFPDGTIHPADVLDSTKGPYPILRPGHRKRLSHLIRQKLVRRLLGRPPKTLGQYYLAVQGFALKSKL